VIRRPRNALIGRKSGSHRTPCWRRQSRANPSLQRPNHCKLKRQSANFPRTGIFCARKIVGKRGGPPHFGILFPSIRAHAREVSERVCAARWQSTAGFGLGPLTAERQANRLSPEEPTFVIEGPVSTVQFPPAAEASPLFPPGLASRVRGGSMSAAHHRSRVGLGHHEHGAMVALSEAAMDRTTPRPQDLHTAPPE
jgi:hypothetical protein